MKENIRSKIETAIEGLPPLSPSVNRILELANDLRASPKDLLEVIRLDPVLTAKILKLINSAFYGLPNQITNVGKALILLGFNTIKNLALSTAVLDSLHEDESAEDIYSLWDHCLGAAVGSKMLAARMGILAKNQDEYFVAGLIHDIGRVVMIRYLGHQYRESMQEHHGTQPDILKIEQSHFGIDHCEAGGIMCNKWNLPSKLTEVVTDHHKDSPIRLVNAVLIASIYCKSHEVGYDVDGNHTIPENAFRWTRLDTQTVDETLATLPKEMEKSQSILLG